MDQRTNIERRIQKEREMLKLLYRFFFSSLIFIFRIRVVDLSCNIELGSLNIKLHLCLNLKGN